MKGGGKRACDLSRKALELKSEDAATYVVDSRNLSRRFGTKGFSASVAGSWYLETGMKKLYFFAAFFYGWALGYWRIMYYLCGVKT